jgi:hypothetical protein
MAILLLSITVVVLSVLAYFQYRAIRDFPRQLERSVNRFVARETELLDRIMHQANQTWTPPPRPVAQEDDEEDEELKLQLQGWEQV